MQIIAGIGLNSFSEDKLRKIILAGADILRYNFSYRTIDENIIHIKTALKIIENLHADTKILIDLPIYKIRLGDFDLKIFAVREGEHFIFKSCEFSPDCNEFIPVQTENLGQKVKKNQTILIGDGEIAIQITSIIDDQTVEGMILNNGVIKYYKSFNILEKPEKEKFLQYYTEIIKKITPLNPDYVSFSFVDRDINEDIKKIFIENKIESPKKIIKIETENGIKNIDEISNDKFYDLIMMDRGELGVNEDFCNLGIYEEKIIHECSKNKKPLIISTHILESTINNFVPNSSEICELTDLVNKKIWGVMLCQETAIGLRPAYSISVAKKIINSTIKYKKNGT